jgi:orotate phosphoribosyltransferase
MEPNGIVNTISNWSLIAVVGVLAIYGLYDLLDVLGFLPPFLRIKKREYRFLKMMMEELGLDKLVEKTREWSHQQQLQKIVPHLHDNAIVLESLVKKYTKKFRKDLIIGYQDGLKTPLKYFVDLMQASSNYQDNKRLAAILADFIARCPSKDPPTGFDKIAVPFRGSTHLGVLVATMLEMPFVIVGDSPLPADQISSRFDPDDRFIIVADVVTSGGSISNIASTIRKQGGVVHYCFTLVERTDRRPVPSDVFLEENGIFLQSILSYDDEKLRALLGK